MKRRQFLGAALGIFGAPTVAALPTSPLVAFGPWATEIDVAAEIAPLVVPWNANFADLIDVQAVVRDAMTCAFEVPPEFLREEARKLEWREAELDPHRW